jgi:hypothetical protein
MTCAGNRLAGYEIAVFCAPDGRCIGRGRAGDIVDGMEAPHDVQRVLVVDCRSWCVCRWDLGRLC